MRKIVLLLALACSGCHACMAALLAEDEPSESTDPAARNAPPGTATATEGTATAAATATAAPTGATTAKAKPTAAPTVAPTPAPTPTNPPQNLGGNSGGVTGRYECFQMRVTFIGGYFNTTFVPGALPGFTIDGAGGYTSSGKPGNVNASSNDVTFTGGPYDGWRGATGSNSTGFYVRFDGKTPSNPRVGDTAKSGDYICYRQKP